MRIDNPLVDVLLKHPELFENKNVILGGEIDSPVFVHLAKITKSCHLHIDNYNVMLDLANTFMSDPKFDGFESTFTYKHMTAHFCSAQNFAKNLQKDSSLNIDTVVIFLTKIKNQCYKLIKNLEPLFDEKTEITVIGRNEVGGKSSYKILSSTNEVYKIESRKKCTLFGTTYKNTYEVPYANEDFKTININNKVPLLMKQDVSIFAHGSLDEGTKDLLEVLSHYNLQGDILDACSGSGVIGLYALKAYANTKVTMADISASALYCAHENAVKNDLISRCNIIPFMMNDEQIGTFDVILTNPPFHTGHKVKTDLTRKGIIGFWKDLKVGGQLFIVYNTFLDYRAIIDELFVDVEIQKCSAQYTVVRAVKGSDDKELLNRWENPFTRPWRKIYS